MFENPKKKIDLQLCLTFVLSFVPSEWYIFAVTSVSFLGVLVFLFLIAGILVCYLRGPEKTPAVLVRTFNQILAGGKKEEHTRIVELRFFSSFSPLCRNRP